MTECHNGIVIEKHWLKWEKVHKIKESTRSKPQYVEKVKIASIKKSRAFIIQQTT